MIFPELHYETEQPELRFIDTGYDDNGNPYDTPFLTVELDPTVDTCGLLYTFISMIFAIHEDGFMDGYIQGLADGKAEAEEEYNYNEDEDDEE